MSGVWSRIGAVTERALALGALQPIDTRTERVDDGDVAFMVRVIERLADKPVALPPGVRGENPFSPYEEAMYVADLGPDHVALLNKFMVIEDHLLVVTRAYAPQTSRLEPADFAAVLQCFGTRPVLAFYNGGEAAGASQPHRHLQVVPLPLHPDFPALPLDPERVTKVPFARHVQRFATPPTAAEAHAAYLAGLDAFGLAPLAKDGLTRPYNLLLTERWSMVIPRLAEHVDGISINALGFAGALLVKNEAQLDRLRERGPFAALRAVVG